jgi:hypothetical protein
MTAMKFALQRWLCLISVMILTTLFVKTEAIMSKKIIRLGFPIGMTDEGDVTNIAATAFLSTFTETIGYLNRRYKPLNVEILYSYFDSGIPSFTSGVQSGLFFNNKALFNGMQVHGVIGGGSNSVTVALAQILTESDIAQISYASDASELSHLTFGEVHSRVSPSSSDQVVAMADMIYNSFGWRRVAVIYSTDTDGIDSLALFQLRARQLGFHIIDAVPVVLIPGKDSDPVSEAALVASVTELVSREARIFVLLVFNLRQAQEILYVASKYQLFSRDSILIGNNVVTTELLWQGIPDVGNDNYKTVADILGGYIGKEEPKCIVLKI